MTEKSRSLFQNSYLKNQSNNYNRNNHQESQDKDNDNENIAFNPDQPQNKIFVSKYYEIKPFEIQDFLSQYRIQHKMRNGEYVIKYCPFCEKPHNNDPSNMETCNIHAQKGFYKCFRCDTKGSWFDFKNKILQKYFGTSLSELVQEKAFSKPPQHSIPEFGVIQDQETINSNWQAYDLKLAHKNYLQFQKNIYENINEYLMGTKDPEHRFLKKEVLEVYKVGVGKEKFRNDYDQLAWFDCVYFPLYSPRNKKLKQKIATDQSQVQSIQEEQEADKVINTEHYEIVKMKVRALGKENKHRQKLLPAGSQIKGLFGLTTVSESDKAIVITEGEFDAMAVYQETGLPTVSLPNGANHFPVQFLPFFERFERIYLWMDADEVGRSAAEKFAQKVGMKRTIIIDSRLRDPDGPKDANDALRQGKDFKKIFQECSKTLGDQNLLSFSDLKDKVVKRIMNYNELSGIQSKYFTFYNRTLKGFRKGELTLLTGATGSGKTTFLSQLSIDFLSQGVPTLWGSFEIKNEILAHTMLQQYSRKKLTDRSVEKLDVIIENFEQHPLYFLNFYGSTHVDLLFETLDYAIYAYDIQFICIDNMQFMLSQQAAGLQKFELQDKVISMLRQLATDKNVHIALVIHPKKVEDDNNLTVGSIFGTAKVTQEADSVLILQKNNVQNYRIMQVKKNRFDGEVGEVSMLFNPENKRYFEITAEEKNLLLLSNGNFNNILKLRKQKYGCVEPLKDGEHAADEPDITTNKTKKEHKARAKDIAKTDLSFYEKLRDHITKKEEPDENRISTKTRHIYFTSSSSESEDSSGGGEDGDSGIVDGISLLADQIEVDPLSLDLGYEALIQAPQDLSINETELLEKMFPGQVSQSDKNNNTSQQETESNLNINNQPQNQQEQQTQQNSSYQEQDRRNKQVQEHFQKLNEQSLEATILNQKKKYYIPNKKNEFNGGENVIVIDDFKQSDQDKQSSQGYEGKNNQEIKQNQYKQQQYPKSFKPQQQYRQYNQQPSNQNINSSNQSQQAQQNDSQSPYKYTLEGFEQDEKLIEIQISKEKYTEVDTIIRPKWIKDLKYMQTFFDLNSQQSQQINKLNEKYKFMKSSDNSSQTEFDSEKTTNNTTYQIEINEATMVGGSASGVVVTTDEEYLVESITRDIYRQVIDKEKTNRIKDLLKKLPK